MLASVIFDMDGVLIDSEPMYFTIQRAFFKELGINLKAGEDTSFVGWSDESMWMYLKSGFPHVLQPVSELTATCRNRFKEYLKDNPDQAKPIAGVTELLVALRAAGISCLVASSSAPDNIRLICDTLGITDYFSHLVSGTEVPHSKPAPDVFLRAAHLAGAKPQQCVVIEDSTNGVKAANAAGMKCIAYRNPGSGAQDISTANLIIEHFNDLTVQEIRALVDR